MGIYNYMITQSKGKGKDNGKGKGKGKGKDIVEPQRVQNNDDTIGKLYNKLEEGDYYNISILLNNEKYNFNILGSYNESPLHIIINNDRLSKNQKYELCKFAIENGAHVDKPNQDNQTPLLLASADQNVKLVEYLIEKGANINFKDNGYHNALFYAVSPYETK